MTSVTPEQEREVIEHLVPRITAFCGALTETLRQRGHVVETEKAFLLNSSKHAVDVPSHIDHVPLTVDFTAEWNAWQFGPRATFRVRVGDREAKTYRERHPGVTGFPMLTIVKLLLREVHEALCFNAHQVIALQQLESMKQQLRLISERTGLQKDRVDPHLLRGGTVRIKGIPERPAQVVLMVLCAPVQAVEILDYLANAKTGKLFASNMQRQDSTKPET